MNFGASASSRRAYRICRIDLLMPCSKSTNVQPVQTCFRISSRETNWARVTSEQFEHSKGLAED